MNLTEFLITGNALKLISNSESSFLSESMLGAIIDGYQLTKTLGQGGMGVVFEAERVNAAFERKVAIKIINPSVFTPQLLVNFTSEQQILSKLSHPNIAQLIDGNVTSDGLPYMVIEYIDGKSLSKYLNDTDLSLKERLSLFLKIASAVAYAHEHQIIHRDIKPENILITAQGEPKLLDFGISDLQLEPDKKAEDASPYTPRFGSPEQLTGKSISFRSDIYQLGYILNLIITNKHLITIKDPKDITKLITENNLPKFNSDEFKNNTKSKFRGIKNINYEIEIIINTCLMLAPADRYPTVHNLMSDIDNFLTNKPISLKANSKLYRLKKSFIRNKILYLLFTSFVLSLIYYIHSLNNSNIAIAKSAQEYKSANKILKNILGGVDTLKTAKKEPSISDVIKIKGLELSQDKSIPIEVKADILTFLAFKLLDRGNYESAESLLIGSVDLNAKPANRAEAVIFLDLGYVLSRSGKKTADVIKYAELGFNYLSENDFYDDSWLKLVSLELYGWILKEQKKEAAEFIFDQLLEERQKIPDYISSPSYLNFLGNYASAKFYDFMSKDSEKIVDDSYNLHLKKYGEEHSRIAPPLTIKAASALKHKNFALCIEYNERAIKIATKFDLKEASYWALHSLGECYIGMKMYAKGVDSIREKLKIKNEIYGDNSKPSTRDIKCLNFAMNHQEKLQTEAFYKSLDISQLESDSFLGSLEHCEPSK